jgi:ATP-dependent Clp protease ATP-binding subunit ClpC
MFENYTEKARRVIFFARYEAGLYGKMRVESEHLLLGLVRESAVSVPIESVRKEIGPFDAESKIPTSVEMPISWECKNILDWASRSRREERVGVEHLLLGLQHEEESLGARILSRLSQGNNDESQRA